MHLERLPLEDEANLLLRLADGDERAFEAVFHHYRRRIYAYGFHLFENGDRADELVQDVFLKVWINRHKIPRIVRFDAWLFIMTRNHVFDTLKEMARELSAKKVMEETPSPTLNTVENQLISKENDQRLRYALDRLSPQQKLIFTLSRQQGMKHGEIATHLNISVNTVKTHLVHALKTLRGALHLPSDSVLFFCVLLHYFPC